MTLVKAKWNKLLHPRLHRSLIDSYRKAPKEYKHLMKPYRVIKYNTGFQISKELLNDDLYGGKVRGKNKGQLMIRTEYVIETYYGTEIKAEPSGLISIGEMSVTSASAKEIADAIYKLLKKTKYKPEVEFVAKKRKKRTRRKNAK